MVSARHIAQCTYTESAEGLSLSIANMVWKRGERRERGEERGEKRERERKEREGGEESRIYRLWGEMAGKRGEEEERGRIQWAIYAHNAATYVNAAALLLSLLYSIKGWSLWDYLTAAANHYRGVAVFLPEFNNLRCVSTWCGGYLTGKIVSFFFWLDSASPIVTNPGLSFLEDITLYTTLGRCSSSLFSSLSSAPKFSSARNSNAAVVVRVLASK